MADEKLYSQWHQFKEKKNLCAYGHSRSIRALANSIKKQLWLMQQRGLHHKIFLKAQNPRPINKSGFKLRAAYDGVHRVDNSIKSDIL